MCKVLLKEGTENMDFVKVIEMLTQTFGVPELKLKK